MLCDDFARMGYQDVVVDAGVQVAYSFELAREMMAGDDRGMRAGARVCAACGGCGCGGSRVRAACPA